MEENFEREKKIRRYFGRKKQKGMTKNKKAILFLVCLVTALLIGYYILPFIFG